MQLLVSIFLHLNKIEKAHLAIEFQNTNIRPRMVKLDDEAGIVAGLATQWIGR